jgi:hypothetical protein
MDVGGNMQTMNYCLNQRQLMAEKVLAPTTHGFCYFNYIISLLSLEAG